MEKEKEPGNQLFQELEFLRQRVTEIEEAARKRVLESEEKYRAIFENTGTATTLIEEDATLVLVNAEFEKLSGYSKEEIEGKKKWPEFVVPEDLERMLEYHRLRRINEAAAPRNYEFRFVDRYGKIKNIFLTIAMIPGTKISVASLLDISYVKESEQRLRKQQRLLELIFNATPDLLVLKDRDSVYQMINNAFCNFLQKSPEEIIGKTDFDLFPADEAEMYHRDDARVMETKQPQLQEEEVTGAAGKKWLYVAKTPVVDDSGEVIGVLCSVRDITHRKQVEEALNQTLKKLQRTILQTIEAMARVVEMRDPYTAGHQRRVAELACAIAEELGLPEDKVRGIQMAALIHDIGKIGVPAEILNKPAKLSSSEFNLVKVHPRVGYEILKEIDFPWPIAQTVLQHHERLNGSGYPSGLKGGAILLESRILGVADVVEAMASHRPYRPAFSIEEALQEVSRNSGILYDAGIVKICLKLFKEKGFTFG